MLRQATYLKKNDKIAIVSTARKISREEIALAIDTFESWGLEVILGKTIDLSHHQYAGTDQERAADFQEMLDRDDIKAIICARGGYGTIRIMDYLNFTAFINKPKWIVGYSDITILHTHINTYFGIQTIHATMPINFKDNSEASLISLKNALFGNNYTINFPANNLNRLGTVQGEIIGGNLSILYSILGTKSGFKADNKILFIEDLDEYLYHLDRMMLALKRAGKLNKLKAIIVGGMTKMHDNNIPFGKNAEEIIAEHCSSFHYPICFNAPCGHLDNNNALIFGKEVNLKIEDSNVIIEL